MTKKKILKKEISITVPINWHMPDNIISRFANNMVVQTLENEFKILFFETKPEIYLDIPRKPPIGVQSECVASIIINAEKLPHFIKALQRQYDRYIEIKSKK